MICFVERHWEIVFRRYRPACQNGTFGGIDNLDFTLLGYIHKKTRPRFFQLKRFRMGIDDNISGLASIRVDESEPSGSRFAFSQLLRTGVANDDTLAARVISNVVGVIRELDCSNVLKRGRVKHLRDPIQAAGNEQMVRSRIVEDTLRLGEVGDGVDALP